MKKEIGYLTSLLEGAVSKKQAAESVKAKQQEQLGYMVSLVDTAASKAQKEQKASAKM